MTSRRAAIGVLAALSLPLNLFSQQQKLRRIGVLAVGVSTAEQQQWAQLYFLKLLRDAGFEDGRNITVEWRFAEGNVERLPALADELVRLNVEVIVASFNQSIAAAKRATRTIPVVMLNAVSPVEAGFVDSLARPGGNVTGIAMFGPEISAKQLELLKAAVPPIARVGVLGNSANPPRKTTSDAMRATAKSLKLDLHAFDVRSSKDFGGAFAAMAKGRIDAVWVSGDSLFQAHWKEIANLAAKQRLPTVGRKEFAQAGGLIGYSQDDAERYRRGAYYVDRILKGAKPADLPVEQPTRFELVVNLKTAKALGITIPQAIRIRADRVIE